jgi:hypothetical protein
MTTRKKRTLAEVVREVVDNGADTAEEIHKQVAAMPLNVLERLDLFEGTVKDVRRIQERSIGAVYETIHRINHDVTELAEELLDGRGRKPKKRPARKPAKRPAKAAGETTAV